LGLLQLRRLEISADLRGPEDLPMRSHFIPHPFLAGDGRCRICDLAYSQLIPAEVEHHRKFHERYLAACDAGVAPVPEAERQQRRASGLAVQFNNSVPFQDRLAAAESWLVASHHEHLFAVLLHNIRRMDLREYFTKHVKPKRLTSFQPDVATELRFRYSDAFIS
jgi:hypothetical protein